MELMIKFVLGTASTIILGLVTNFISDKLKSHSREESGFEFEFKFIEIKFKRK